MRTGDKVPADLRIIEAKDLKVNKSSLTGKEFFYIKNKYKSDTFQFYKKHLQREEKFKSVQEDIIVWIQLHKHCSLID